MSIDDLKSKIPDFAKDVRLNLSSMASDETLTPQQKYGLFVACGIASRNADVRKALTAEAAGKVDASVVQAAKSAASIMGMNNVYYRFLHLVEDPEYAQLPARLRMNVIGNPGIEKVDFELLSLAVSAINGCGTCVASHERQLRKHEFSREAVQSAVRIAATVHAVARVLDSVKLEAGVGAAEAA